MTETTYSTGVSLTEMPDGTYKAVFTTINDATGKIVQAVESMFPNKQAAMDLLHKMSEVDGTTMTSFDGPKQ